MRNIYSKKKKREHLFHWRRKVKNKNEPVKKKKKKRLMEYENMVQEARKLASRKMLKAGGPRIILRALSQHYSNLATMIQKRQSLTNTALKVGIAL